MNTTKPKNTKRAHAEIFRFGDPEPATGRSFTSLLGVFPSLSGEYYVPPIDLWGLSQMRSANGQHGSCIVFRRNMVENAYRGGGLQLADLSRCATDFLTFGHCFVQVFRDAFGNILRLGHVPALNMRVRTEGNGYRLLRSDPNGKDVDFPEHEILMIREYDTGQQIYGIPDWFGGMQSALLNEEATLFRRKYYVNGAHLGYIMYTSAENLSEEDEDAIRKAIRDGKGIGNFKAAYFHIPGGKEKDIQIIPIGDISQKDEFLNVKNISANDVREAHRTPPVLMGIIPQGTSSLGDPIKVKTTYIETEVAALGRKFEQLNDILPPAKRLKFDYTTKEE